MIDMLPKGITGFGKGLSIAPNYFKEFKQNCYMITNTSKEFHLKEICNPKDTNYFYTKFIYQNHEIYVLLNKFYPKIAFVNKLSYANKIFINVDKLALNFSNYNLPSAEDLNFTFTPQIENQLFKMEIEQVKYYQPISVGNIIFNEWD